MQFRSLDDLSLAEGLARQRPATAALMPELQIPLELDPNAKPGGTEPLYEIYKREERARQTEYVRQQNAQQAAREAEILKRESLQRQQILNGVSGTDSSLPRITSRRPEWEREYAPPKEPRPSTGSPPPTPKTSGLAAEVDLLDRPAPAQPRSPLGINPTPEAKPSNLPISGGAAAVETLARNAVVSSAVGGALDFGFRIVAGQPIQQAAVGALGSTAGSVTGIILGTAVGGPIGGFIGGAIGGFVGGRIADFIYSQAFPRSTDPDKLPTDPKKLLSPTRKNFNPGGVQISFYSTNNRRWITDVVYDYTVVSYQYRKEFHTEISIDHAIAWWPVTYTFTPDIHGYKIAGHSYTYPNGHPQWNNGSPNVNYDPATLTVSPAPPNTTALTPQQQEQVNAQFSYPRYTDNRPPESKQNPLNNSAPASAYPSAGRSQKEGQTNYAPGSTANKSNGTPRGDSPDWVPHGALKGSPHPDLMPAPLLSPLPEFADPELAPRLNLTPSLLPIPENTPSIIVNEDGTIELVNYRPLSTNDLQPISLDQSFPSTVTLTSPASDPGRSTASPFSVSGSFSARPSETLSKSPTASLPTTTQSNAQPDATRPVSASTAPPVAGQSQSQTSSQTQATEKQLEDLQKTFTGKLDELGLGLAAITQIVQGLQRNTTPEAIKSAAAAGTCSTLQPGGCMAPLASDAKKAADNSANNSNNLERVLNNTSNLADLTLLPIINNKLGNQIAGGIGPKLKNFVDWAVVDRVVNLITMTAALHNVFMLTNSIQDTFFEAVDNVLAIPALINNPDADTVDSKQAITGFLDKYFAQLFGVSEWSALKSQWKAFSTISSTTAQAYNNLREIHNDSQELLNQNRNYTAQLGNALTDEGVISEDNWDYKDPNQKIKSKGLNRLERMANGLEAVENSLEAIEQVTATLRNITETANEIKENVAAIDKAVNDANQAAKEDREAKIEGLELPNFSLDDLF